MDQLTMKAVVYHGGTDLRIEDVPTPKLEYPNNAIVRVTMSTICGTDVHIVGGHFPVTLPTVMGHEFVGEVVEIGPDVLDFKVGDRVAVACVAACGVCEPCKNGQPVHCTKKNVGCFGLGKELPGCQTEYVRVPFADNTMYRIPDSLEYEDVLFVGDILSTGFFGAESAEIRLGDTVLVVGCGPVGMCAAVSARQFGPAKIIMVDGVDSRLEIAKREGLCDYTINYTRENVEQRVLELTNSQKADRAIEAIGKEESMLTCLRNVRPGGNVAILGVFGGPVKLPMNEQWSNNVTIRCGFVPVNRIDELIKMIEAGKINMRFLQTHKAPLNDVLRGYDVFGKKRENVLKWVITPWEK